MQGGGGINFYIQWKKPGDGSYSDIPHNVFSTTLVDLGPSAWFKSDDVALSSMSDGANVATNFAWPDATGAVLDGKRNNVLRENLGTARYYKTSSDRITNYNPVMYVENTKFNSSYSVGLPFGTKERSIVSMTELTFIGDREFITGVGKENTSTPGGSFTVGVDNTERISFHNNLSNATPRTEHLGNSIHPTGSGSVDPIPHILEHTYTTGTSTNNGILIGYNEGKFQGSKSWDINTQFNDNAQLTVGNDPDGKNGNGWDGYINEVIHYPWALTNNERQRVNTYLTIKWGTSLDQSSPQNYLASNSAIVWNASTNSEYNNVITGIARDDQGALLQKQSFNTSSEAFVKISNDPSGLVANNPSNTSSFSADKSYLLFGDNGSA